jgi:mannosyl-oligosaccharide alpha-1,2-mannosidase
MSDKMLRSLGFPRPPSLRSAQARSRYLLALIVVLVLFFSFRSSKLSNSNGLYRIQASFPTESAAAKSVRLRRQGLVKDAFRHAWTGYKQHAWLHDEVMPLSEGHKDTFVGWAATLVDALDTLYIMGLKDEFEEALQGLEQVDFSKPNSDHVPTFETTIRYLGGFLGAWDISGHDYPILLEKAKELGDFLYRAFNTESGAPVPYYKWKQDSSTGGKLAGENGVIVAQIGSLSLEFIRLSQVTGDPRYADAIQKITNQLENTQNHTTLPGMWPSQVDCAGSQLSFSSQAYTLGAFAGKFALYRLSITDRLMF